MLDLFRFVLLINAMFFASKQLIRSSICQATITRAKIIRKYFRERASSARGCPISISCRFSVHRLAEIGNGRRWCPPALLIPSLAKEERNRLFATFVRPWWRYIFAWRVDFRWFLGRSSGPITWFREAKYLQQGEGNMNPLFLPCSFIPDTTFFPSSRITKFSPGNSFHFSQTFD